jgi:hypothetical protein
VSRDDELGRELNRLYELPLTEFIAARDEAAKLLRAEGRRDVAEELKRLRKPTTAVWLVNRLARERGLDVKRLLKAGAALSESQAGVAAGGSTEEFAQARREETRALERLAAAAREVAGREGIGAAAADRAVQTLRAASLSDEGRELLERGRLTEELEPPGFDALTGLAQSPVPKREKRRPPADDRAERRRAVKEARERVAALRAEERELGKAARDAEREAHQAEAAAASLREAAAEAVANAEAAAEARAAAESELRAAEEASHRV